MTHPPSEQSDLLLDPATATLIANRGLSLQLGTTTLPEMDAEATALEVQLRLFLGAGLPEEEEEADEQRREVQALLNSVPAGSDVAVASWTRVRAMARALRRHIEQYTKRNSCRSLQLSSNGRDAHLPADGSAGIRDRTTAPVTTGEGAAV
ncbi:hypothetical protein ACGFR6_04790 [Streptomyces sp. NPDC048567]|uniref:hypothetical protein n=1 Tax=Streptomyces sp. NPDC048567 TaxID=3365570 RepID=UPI003715B84F